MNALENLYSRKSVRSFTGEGLSPEELRELLKAAYAAPVGRAQYGTLHLTVIRNPEFLSKWEGHVAAAMGNPAMHCFYGAPVVILVSSSVAPGPACNINYSNAAIISQNIALAATALGIGACHIWGAVMALNGDEALLRELALPEGMVPCCAMALGKTGECYTLREIPENRIATDYMD